MLSFSTSSSASRELRECDAGSVKQKRDDRAGLPRFCANQTAVCENAGAVFGIISSMEIEQVYREVAPKLQSCLTGNGCSYATACDIVQETFLRLWKRKDELSGDLHQVSGLAFTIARNYRTDLARKAQHEVFIERDIASGTGASEANVKVRVHRAKEMLGKVMKCGVEELRGCEVEKLRGKGFGWVAFRVVMMLAAVDGEIDKEELSLYRELVEKFREGNAADFDALWAESVKGMAAADGDYSQIERDCVAALAKNK